MRPVFCFVLAIVATSLDSASAQSLRVESIDLEKTYVPVLDSVKARFWAIDPKLGYAVKSVGGGVYVLSDNMWQSAIVFGTGFARGRGGYSFSQNEFALSGFIGQTLLA